jgi:hypothetical protein
MGTKIRFSFYSLLVLSEVQCGSMGYVYAAFPVSSMRSRSLACGAGPMRIYSQSKRKSRKFFSGIQQKQTAALGPPSSFVLNEFN